MDNKIRQYLDKECPYCNGKIKKMTVRQNISAVNAEEL